MTELMTLKNIGREMDKKLKAAGISSAEELKSIGSKEAFIRLKVLYPYLCNAHLRALEGAVSGVKQGLLPDDVKQRLKAFNDNLK